MGSDRVALKIVNEVEQAKQEMAERNGFPCNLVAEPHRIVRRVARLLIPAPPTAVFCRSNSGSQPHVHFAQDAWPPTGFMTNELFTDTAAGLSTHTVFTDVLVAKAALYRAILEVFVRSREQFMTHLRPAEVARKIGCDEEETEHALRMLQQWGNLEATQDSAEAVALEEFYRSRFLYALSAPGEAAERALAVFEETVHQPGELQTAALRDIAEFLEVIRVLIENPEPDVAKLHTQLLALTERFRNLTWPTAGYSLSPSHRGIARN
jgi:hypothetical protein